MGDHYIPQYYLKGFSPNDGKTIWVYDKQEKCKFSTQVKSTANINNFYTPGTERYLSNEIENIANPVIEKIRIFEPLNDHDKAILADYITTMIKRTLAGEGRFQKLLPNTIDKLKHCFDDKFSIAATNQPHKTPFYEARRADIGKILDKHSQNDRSRIIFSKTIPIKMTPKITDCLKQMTWTFWTSKGSPKFLTCDNPVFFLPGRGIGNPNSELTFPISSYVALWLHRGQYQPEGFATVSQRVVQDINRRTISNATRYVFHCLDEDWILPMAIQHSLKA